MYLETEFVPNKEEAELIDFAINSAEFPWYFQESTDKKYMFFGHSFLKRNNDVHGAEGQINSQYYPAFVNIFLKICKENNVKVNSILRGALNATSYLPDKYGNIHIDHDFPHNNFILYLNNFTGAPTYIFNENKELIKTTAVGKNKAVFFSGEPHAQGFCAPHEHRFVLVFTFN